MLVSVKSVAAITGSAKKAENARKSVTNVNSIILKMVIASLAGTITTKSIKTALARRPMALLLALTATGATLFATNLINKDPAPNALIAITLMIKVTALQSANSAMSTM